MSYSDLIRSMIAEGATPQLILLAVEAVEARDNAAAEGREKAAERKRRQRAKERDTDVTVTGQSQDNAETAPFPSPPNENNLTPPTHTPEYNTPRAKADPFPRPDGIETAIWADFLTNRKRKRLPNTATAHEGLLADLADLSARTGWPPGEVLKACVAKGWGAVFETDKMKEAINGRQPANQQISRGGSGKRDSRDGFERACDRLIERAEAGRQPDGGIGSGGQRALAAPRAL